jgi:adenine-specific DNA-methyltransferase
MATNKLNKLELTWIGKDDERPILEPRILIEDKSKSYGHPIESLLPNGKPWKGNMLIHGDNLLALKSIESDFAGLVKCVYIDPPYNTGAAFEHYDDNVEHSIWLSLMRERLIILKNLLTPDGFICCEIDDSEGQYLKVLMDEVFGRDNYLTTFYVRVRYPDKTLKQDMDFHKEIEQIHIYQNSSAAIPNKQKEKANFDKFEYYFTEGEPSKIITLGGKTVEIFEKGNWSVEKREGSEEGRKEIWASGTILDGNSSGRFFRDYLTGRYDVDGYGVLYKVHNIGDDKFDYRYFTGPQKIGATKGKYYQGVPLSQLNDPNAVKYKPINSFYDFAANFGNCRGEGNVDFRGGKKPEILLKTIIEYFSNRGEIILDSFLGSGTTAAVAQKLERKWIGIEMGNQAYTHCIPRISNIIDNKDVSGISKLISTRNNNGFRFYELAPSLLNEDKFGNMVINKDYNADMLAAAMAKHEGFTYAPNAESYWKQGYSSEHDYIYTTTQFLTAEGLDAIHGQMGEDESLLICCTKFQSECNNRYGNITIKKIPKMLLDRCEFAKDDYSLNIVCPPSLDEDNYDDENDITDCEDNNEQSNNNNQSPQLNLFD